MALCNRKSCMPETTNDDVLFVLIHVQCTDGAVINVRVLNARLLVH